MLEMTRRWDREISLDEQLSLAFARMALQGPSWVLIDDTFGMLDNEALARVVDVLTGELAQTAVIYVGRAEHVGERLFPRVLHLVKADPTGAGAAAGPGAVR
jgi:putative ATP-binding cassette transporter